MKDEIREFGTPVLGENYILRPGGYAVIFRSTGEVAVVKTPLGYFLPGGGQERGETPADAAVRETKEECGLSIRIVQQIGTADELVYAADEATYFRKRCTFFLAEICEVSSSAEPGHILCWSSLAAAATKLQHESQRWAVEKSRRIIC